MRETIEAKRGWQMKKDDFVELVGFSLAVICGVVCIISVIFYLKALGVK